MSSPAAQTIGLYGYICTFPLGFIGHICSLVTFSSKSLRNSSTGLLFIFLTVSDIMYQLMSIQDFLTQNLQISIGRSVYLCRLRTFILNFSTVTSSWFLVLISLDRLVRVCFPYQQIRICTQKMTFLSVSIVCICSISFTSHVLQSDFVYTIPARQICGPLRTPETFYSTFYFYYWPFLQLLITYFIPCCLMIVSLVSIQNKIRKQQIQVQQSTRKEKIQRQMLILMISSTICFAICTLPYSIHRIIYLKLGTYPNTLIEIAVFTICLDMNYCYHFYIHCLSSKYFREKFIEQIKRFVLYCTGQKLARNMVFPMTTVTKSQNQQTSGTF